MKNLRNNFFSTTPKIDLIQKFIVKSEQLRKEKRQELIKERRKVIIQKIQDEN
jgi:ribosome maturation protein Sdo1